MHGSPSHPPAQLPLIAVAAEGRRSAFDTPSRVAYPALAGELQRLSLSSPSDAGQRGIPSMAAAIDKATQHEANLLRHQLELNARVRIQCACEWLMARYSSLIPSYVRTGSRARPRAIVTPTP